MGEYGDNDKGDVTLTPSVHSDFQPCAAKKSPRTPSPLVVRCSKRLYSKNTAIAELSTVNEGHGG